MHLEFGKTLDKLKRDANEICALILQSIAYTIKGISNVIFPQL